MKIILGLGASLLVALGGALAFSPRSMPSLRASDVPVERMQLNAVHETSAGLVVAGELGLIRLSSDQGRSWSAANVASPRQALINRVVFADANQGLALGHEGWILRSSDGGRNWEETAFSEKGGAPLLDGARLPCGDWLVVGAFGRVLRSSDDGASWYDDVISGVTDWHLNGIAGSADGQRWLIVGEGGAVLRSRNAGAKWEALPSFYEGSFYGALSLGADRWLVYGMRGHVFRSDDGGEHWSPLSLPLPVSLHAGRVTPDGTVLLAGQGGVLLASDDAGRSFRVLRQVGQEILTDLAVPAAGPWLLASDAGLRRFDPITQLSGSTEEVRR